LPRKPSLVKAVKFEQSAVGSQLSQGMMELEKAGPARPVQCDSQMVAVAKNLVHKAGQNIAGSRLNEDPSTGPIHGLYLARKTDRLDQMLGQQGANSFRLCRIGGRGRIGEDL
jgi:hypothetical protein